MSSDSNNQKPTCVERLWSSVTPLISDDFISFIGRLEQKEQEFDVKSCPHILQAFIALARQKIDSSDPNSDWWLAYTLLLSDVEAVWRFLVEEVSPSAIDRINGVDFYRDLSENFLNTKHFQELYARSLLRHPESKVTHQALLDCQEIGSIARQLYPEGRGLGLHKKRRKALRAEAEAKFAEFSREEQHRIMQLVLTRYFLVEEHSIHCPGECILNSPNHELILFRSESIWRKNLESDPTGLWVERLHRSEITWGPVFMKELKYEFHPRWPSRPNFDFQGSCRDERVWARYLTSLVNELVERVDEWFFNWHLPTLSRSNFNMTTSALLHQVEDTKTLIAAARAISDRLPEVLRNNWQLDRVERLMTYLGEYFESGEDEAIFDWVRRKYPDDK